MPKRYIRRPDGTLIEDNGAVDSSLAIVGAAADAKAVGDKLSEVSKTIISKTILKISNSI